MNQPVLDHLGRVELYADAAAFLSGAAARLRRLQCPGERAALRTRCSHQGADLILAAVRGQC